MIGPFSSQLRIVKLVLMKDAGVPALQVFTLNLPGWVATVAAIPAAIMLWTLIAWNPEGKKQWFLAAGMALYVAAYYFLFARH